MDNGKWQVHVSRDPSKLGGGITIYRYVESDVEMVRVMPDGILNAVKVMKGDTIVHPTMYVGNEEELRGIIAAFQELGNAMGIKRPDESFAQGKLEAVSEHLADMRTLVFKSKSHGK